MSEKKYNRGFSFYDTYWKTIEHLPYEEQCEDLYALILYGITGEIVDKDKMPHGYSIVQNNKGFIDESVYRWNHNIVKANIKEDKRIANETEIAKLILEGLKSKEIGERVGLSDSAVRKTKVWKERKTNPALLQQLSQNVNLEQNVMENVPKNNVIERENSRDVRENVKMERENSQEITENGTKTFDTMGF